MDDVAVPDEAFMTEFRDFSLSTAISNIEGRAEAADSQEFQASDDDVMPMAAAEMGAGQNKVFLYFCGVNVRVSFFHVNSNSNLIVSRTLFMR